ncbi:TonB-dependent receptor [Sphingobacterium sp. E70]|uniref:TonB-dependent receptor n=1 Tax=Sphingobacterium sp. E70 TaxID=2853439 RepID=UPI00211BF555|nr:TonB-dependent receptor [Sphingobacterium sp. E70]
MKDDTFKRITTLQSYFSRVNYSFDSKYFLSASIRTDGSSRFGPNNKWGTFPSVSGGWTISKEDFYTDWLGQQSTLKLRASWGVAVTIISESIAQYLYLIPRWCDLR